MTKRLKRIDQHSPGPPTGAGKVVLVTGQCNREDSNFKNVSKKREGGKKPVILKLYLDEEGEAILQVFKEVAEKWHWGKRGWLTEAVIEAMKLYVKRYGSRLTRPRTEKIKINAQTKRVLRDFFAYVVSFFRCLQPGLRRRLIYMFLDRIGVMDDSTKYRYLRRMIKLGLLIYAYTDFDKEPVYRIDWDAVLRLFPELYRPGLRRIDWRKELVKNFQSFFKG